MNTENADRVIGHIESMPPRAFNMGTWGERSPECGTVACLAGWTCELLDRPVFDDYIAGKFDEGQLQDRAAELLGLDYDTADRLFFATILGWEQVKESLKFLSNNPTATETDLNRFISPLEISVAAKLEVYFV